MPVRIFSGRTPSKLEQQRRRHAEKRHIREKLLGGLDENDEFQGVLTEADAQRLAQLVNQGVRR